MYQNYISNNSVIFYQFNRKQMMNFNFNFILPKVNTDYIRQAQVLNNDNLRKIILLMNFFYENIKYFNFNFILPKVNTDYIRQAQVLNIDNL